jgi:hypothetical protein
MFGYPAYVKTAQLSIRRSVIMPSAISPFSRFPTGYRRLVDFGATTLTRRSVVITLPNGGGFSQASINPTKQEVHYESLSRHRLPVGVSQITLKKNTTRTCESTLSNFRSRFTDRDLVTVSPNDALSFLTAITEGKKQLPKRTRYSHLQTFFNFIKNTIDQSFHNPCDTPMLRKPFRGGETIRWNILEKDVVGDRA